MSQNCPKVSFLVICYNRKKDVEVCVRSILQQHYPNYEIIVVDNASQDGTEEVFSADLGKPPVQYFRMEANLGVSGGRNEAIARANGDILITIDDDAKLIDVDTTKDVVEKLQADPSLGALGFKIEDRETGKPQRMYFPTREKTRDPDCGFETTWIIGCGHAIPRTVYQEIGVYRDFHPYGSEDFDLSLRILDAGYRIEYFPKARVRHSPAPTGRIKSNLRLAALKLEHRMKAVTLNLPWISIVTHLVVRSATTLYVSRGNPVVLIIAYWSILKSFCSWLQQRRPISRETFRRLRELRGPAYY